LRAALGATLARCRDWGVAQPGQPAKEPGRSVRLPAWREFECERSAEITGENVTFGAKRDIYRASIGSDDESADPAILNCEVRRILATTQG